MGDNKSNQDDSVGCIITCIVIFGGLILALFFPATRGGILARPIVQIWESIFGIPMPAYNFGPIFLKAIFLLFLTAISFIGGISLARFINNRFYDMDLNLQTIGAIASILGLLIGILSLVLK